MEPTRKGLESLHGHQSEYDLEKPVEGNYQTMMMFAVDIKHDETLTRSELSTLTRGFNRMATYPIILFVKNGNKLSLATCERSEYRQEWRDGEKLGKVSILRDINLEHPHRGHIDILETLGDKEYLTFDDLYKHWLDVFSSELLTKKFYTELSEWYAWVIGSGKVKFPNDIRTTEDDTKYNHEAVIRLITRLIFVWFLKQKKLIPEEFFDENAIRENFIENFDPHSTNTLFYNPEESKYYRLILQNLFFAMLNRPIKDEETGNDENRRFRKKERYRGDSFNADFNINNLLRYEEEFKLGGAEKLLEVANSQVPFLNGGLFECLDHKDKEDPEYGMYYDGFTENKVALSQLAFPDYFFFGEEVGSDVDLSGWYDDKKKKHVKVRGLIDILKKYNFTVEENTPLDQEVSLDPELLGKVFENLLASYNPETNTTARKQTGSFYTPRPIVQYMIDESLVAYLKRTCPDIKEETFRSLFDYSDEDFNASEEERKQIISALYACKVLDPACGSGAFPMGILQQMVHALRKLDPSNELWKEFILEKALGLDREAYKIDDDEERKSRRRDIEEAFNRNVNDPDYARKLYLIENCIYGVDIQPIAAQISKLRFFISLVAEQKPTHDSTNNFGIRPLPNLEAKIVASNSLIPLHKEQNLFAATDSLDKIKSDLSKANHELFLAKRNKEKRSIRQKIRELREQYSNELESIEIIGESSARLIASWDMFDPNKFASFFDTEWMFGISEGFDIVIGNPPYIQLQKATGDKGVDKKGKPYDIKYGDLYEPYGYESFAKTGDLYCLFYELGYNLIKPQGTVCYITSNKWMRAGYGEKLRNLFSKKTNPQILIDFGGVRVFESATVDTNILLFSKGANENKTLSVIVGKENKNGVFNLSDFVQQNASKLSFNSSDSWVIISPIEQSIKRKIEAVGTPLKDWDIQINYGIKTGFNDAFIITTETRDEILSKCADEDERKRTEEIIRPILRGRDIKKYSYDWAGLWLIATFPSRNYDIEKYPALKTYLLSFAKDILIENGFSWVAESHLAEYCRKRLEQSGEKIYIDGKLVSFSKNENARKKTNNKWFETQDSISYWDDFSNHKIVYMEIQTDNPDEGYPFPCFSFDINKSIVLNTAYIMSSKTVNTRFLLGILNSKLGKILVKYYVTQLQERQFRMLAQYVSQFPIVRPDNDTEKDIIDLVNNQLLKNELANEIAINKLVYKLYGLTELEIEYVEKNIR